MLLTGFHAIAADRGDGLRPELLALLRHHERHFGGNEAVVEISRRRGDDFVQSGPNPRGWTDAPLPESVLRFPARTTIERYTRKETRCILR